MNNDENSKVLAFCRREGFVSCHVSLEHEGLDYIFERGSKVANRMACMVADGNIPHGRFERNKQIVGSNRKP